MAVKSTKKQNQKDSKKESTFRTLTEALSQAGIRVKREKLRSGSGWQASSGACRLHTDSLLLIDSRLPQDEQINFLADKILSLDAQVPEYILERLPQPLVHKFTQGDQGDSAQSSPAQESI